MTQINAKSYRTKLWKSWAMLMPGEYEYKIKDYIRKIRYTLPPPKTSVPLSGGTKKNA